MSLPDDGYRNNPPELNPAAGPITDTLLPSLVRTWVPLVVALVGPWITAALGLTDDQISSVAALLIAGGYYTVVRLIERFAGPQIGVLLGWAKAPVYPTGLSRR